MIVVLFGRHYRNALGHARFIAAVVHPYVSVRPGRGLNIPPLFPDVVRLFGGNAFEHGTGYYIGASGVALWLPPNVHPREMETMTLLQQTVPEQHQEDVFAMLEQMGSYHAAEPHWYLPMIGVDPSHQGKGYGSALMAHALIRCDGRTSWPTWKLRTRET